MNDEQHEALNALLDNLDDAQPPEDPADTLPEDFGDPTVRALLYAMLRYDATSSQALNAFSRVRAAVVDINELRIAYPDEITALLGPRYPGVAERSERIRDVLGAVFDREHEIALTTLYETPKREARAALEALNGITPYAALRVGLLVFGIHGVPVDDALCNALIACNVLDEGTQPADAAGMLERAIRAADSRDAVLRLEAWIDDGGKPPRKRKGKAAATKDA